MKNLARVLATVGLVMAGAVGVSAQQPRLVLPTDYQSTSTPLPRRIGSWIDRTRPYETGRYFSLNADALWMGRRNAAAQGLVYSNRGDEVLGTSDLGFSPEFGSQISLFLHHYCRYALEFRYAQVDLSSRYAVEGRDYTFDRPGGQIVADAFAASYKSDYDSYEVNFRSQTRPWLNLYGGLRIVDMDEDFSLNRAPFGTDMYDVYHTQNHLYGAQIGGDAMLFGGDQSGPLALELNLRLGLYYNRVDFDGEIISSFGQHGVARDSEDHAAFLGELGLTGLYRLNDRLVCRLGYQLMWIEGLAMAPNQIVSTNMSTGQAALQFDDSLLFHGVFAGISAVF